MIKAQPQFPPPSLQQLQFTPPPLGYMGNVLRGMVTRREPFNAVIPVLSRFFQARVHVFLSSHAGRDLPLSERRCPVPVLYRGIGHAAAPAERDGWYHPPAIQCSSQHHEEREEASPC